MSMTPEQLAALKEVAEKAIETTGGPSLAKHVDALHAFRIKFDPVTCLALLEEVERARRSETAAECDKASEAKWFQQFEGKLR